MLWEPRRCGVICCYLFWRDSDDLASLRDLDTKQQVIMIEDEHGGIGARIALAGFFRGWVWCVEIGMKINDGDDLVAPCCNTRHPGRTQGKECKLVWGRDNLTESVEGQEIVLVLVDRETPGNSCSLAG